MGGRQSGQQLKIYTLGQFQVKRGEHIISESSKRSYKLWNLFNYLLTQKGKSVPSGDLIDILWPNQENVNPEQALRTLIYRLRQVLQENSTSEPAMYITFSQGCYSWNASADYWLDAEEFEELCHKAGRLEDEHPEEAVEVYQQAISLYKGEYLPEYSYNDWITPMRNYYRRLYLEAIVNLTDLLKKERHYAEIRKICEKSFLLEPFEEELHLRFLEALIEEGKYRQARAHYEYVTTIFYREMRVKPSNALMSLYRRIKMDDASFEMDLGLIQDSMKDREQAVGAFYCDPDVFQDLYKLEERRVGRTGQSIFLALLTLTRPNYSLPDQKTLAEVMDILKQVIIGSLRKGDVITRWNDAQYLVLLPGLNYEQGEAVLKRIQTRFRSRYKGDEVVLRLKLQPLRPTDQKEMARARVERRESV